MGKIKAALFDFDGTLCDTEGQYTEVWSRVGRKFRPDIDNLAGQIKGSTLERILQKYFPEPEIQKEVTRELDEFEAEIDYTFFPGAEDFIKDLQKNGVVCAVVTSSNTVKMSQVRKKLPQIDTLFTKIFTAEDFSASKPDPDCYIQAQKALGFEKDECIIFEDALNGLQAGMASGIFTIGMATTNSRETLQSLCDLVLDSFKDISYATVSCVTK